MLVVAAVIVCGVLGGSPAAARYSQQSLAVSGLNIFSVKFKPQSGFVIGIENIGVEHIYVGINHGVPLYYPVKYPLWKRFVHGHWDKQFGTFMENGARFLSKRVSGIFTIPFPVGRANYNGGPNSYIQRRGRAIVYHVHWNCDGLPSDNVSAIGWINSHIGTKLSFDTLPILAQVSLEEPESATRYECLQRPYTNHSNSPPMHPLLGLQVLLASLGILGGSYGIIHAFRHADASEGLAGLYSLLLSILLVLGSSLYCAALLVP